jgi:hypothetical protein
VYSAESLWIIGWFTPNSSGKKSSMACHFPTYKIHHVVRGFPSLPHVDDNGGRAMENCLFSSMIQIMIYRV